MASSPAVASVEHLWELIKDTRFGMFSTRARDGQLCSRPMTTQNSVFEDYSLWFFMSRSAEPALQLSADPRVDVIYSNPGNDRYAVVSGVAQFVDDAQRKQHFWSALALAWFPKGLSDPDLALVQVRVTHAHYWDIRRSKLGQRIELAKAAITRKPPADLGEHGEVRIN